jgi:hypothetical protein
MFDGMALAIVSSVMYTMFRIKVKFQNPKYG